MFSSEAQLKRERWSMRLDWEYKVASLTPILPQTFGTIIWTSHLALLHPSIPRSWLHVFLTLRIFVKGKKKKVRNFIFLATREIVFLVNTNAVLQASSEERDNFKVTFRFFIVLKSVGNKCRTKIPTGLKKKKKEDFRFVFKQISYHGSIFWQ